MSHVLNLMSHTLSKVDSAFEGIALALALGLSLGLALGLALRLALRLSLAWVTPAALSQTLAHADESTHRGKD